MSSILSKITSHAKNQDLQPGKTSFDRNIHRNSRDDKIHRHRCLKLYLHKFKDLKENINKRNREIKNVKEPNGTFRTEKIPYLK